jgi:hypothetical protein
MESRSFQYRNSGTLKSGYLLFAFFWLQQAAICSSQDTAIKTGLKLYVSTAGNDSWSGKIMQPGREKTDGPFATLEGARDAIRKLKKSEKLPEGNILVEIQGGEYELLRTFELEARDGGKDSLTRILYSGRKGDEVRLAGGINLNKWELVTDNDILEKFSQDVRNKIYQTDLAAKGITDFGTPDGKGPELFFNDKPMWISRYPNKGFIKITGLINEYPIKIDNGSSGDTIGQFLYSDERVSKWKDEKDPWFHGYWFWDWREQRQKVELIDTEKKYVKLYPPYHEFGYRKGQWFYGYNLLSEIDEPGEYYIDRDNGMLYFYPPEPLENCRAVISVNKSIIEMKDVDFLTIRGVILEACRGTAVQMTGGKYNRITGCIIRNTGNMGVSVDGGEQNGVTDCDIYETGGTGIWIRGGERSTLTPAGNYADNNYIHHVARLYRTYCPGISLNGVGNRATHNLIAHVPHMAMGFGGNDNLIEYNEIFDAGYESNDAGVIYTGRNWTMRGNIIRYNYFHDISGFEGKGCVGVYLDDLFCGTTVYGNVFNRVTRAAMIGGGRDNKIINNIFIDCVPSLHIDARGLGWYAKYIPPWLKEAEEKGTLTGIAFNKPPFSTRFPELASMLDDEPAAPKGNVVSLNICVGGTWDKASGFWKMSIEDKARPYLKMKDNLVAPGSGVMDSLSAAIVIEDPLFVNRKNPEMGEFQLDANSPALMRGFVQVPFEKMGLYKNHERTRWPVKGE